MLSQKKQIINKIKEDELDYEEAKSYHPGLLLIVLVPYIENLPTDKGIKLMSILMNVIQSHSYNEIVLCGYEDNILTYLLTLPERLPIEWEDDKYFIYIFDKINNSTALNRLMQRGKTELLMTYDKVNLGSVSPVNKQSCLDAMLKLDYKIVEIKNDPMLIKCMLYRSKGLSNSEFAFKIASVIAGLDQEVTIPMFEEYLQYYTNKQILGEFNDVQIDCFIIIGNAFHKIAACNFLWISSFLSAAMEQMDTNKSLKIQHLVNIWYENEEKRPDFKVPVKVQNQVNALLSKPLKLNKVTKRPDMQLVKGWVPSKELNEMLISRKSMLEAPKADSDDESDFGDELHAPDYLEVQPSSKLKKPSFIRQIVAYLEETEDTFKMESAYSNILPILEKSNAADVQQVLPKLLSCLVKANNTCHLQSFDNLKKALEVLIFKFPELSLKHLHKMLVNGDVTQKARIMDAMVTSASKLAETKSFTKFANTFVLTLLNAFRLKNDVLVWKRFALAIQALVLFSKNAYMLNVIVVDCISFYLNLHKHPSPELKKIAITGVDSCFQTMIHSQIDAEDLFSQLPLRELVKFGQFVPKNSLTFEIIKLIMHEN